MAVEAVAAKPKPLGWLKDYEAAYRRQGVDESTVQRYVDEMERLQRTFHIDLATVEPKQLMDHLSDYQKAYKPGAYRLHCVIIKKALKILGRKKLAKEVIIPKRTDPANAIELLPREDRERLIREAPTLQDRLIFELLDETGARRGEIASLRIKDVQFEKIAETPTAILWLNGKTGVRRRRVYGCVADLRAQINNHPRKENPDWTLLYRPDKPSAPFRHRLLYRRVRKLGWRILKKNVRPKMFRHSRATEDCQYFTDRQMMKLFGWKRPDMVAVYSHLTMKDVEDYDLMLHGLKRREEVLRPLVQVVKCPKCGEENAPVAMYCAKCGEILVSQDLDRLMADRGFMEQFVNHPTFQEALKKALATTG
jgi:integrase